MFNAGRIINRPRGSRARSGGRRKAPPVWLKVPKKYKKQQQRLLAAKRRQLNTASLDPFNESLESISKKPYPFVWQALVASLIGIGIFIFGIFLCILGFKADNQDADTLSYEEFLLNHHEEQAQLRRLQQLQEEPYFMDREKYSVVYVRNLKHVVYKVFNSNNVKAFQEQERRSDNVVVRKFHSYPQQPYLTLNEKSNISNKYYEKGENFNATFVELVKTQVAVISPNRSNPIESISIKTGLNRFEDKNQIGINVIREKPFNETSPSPLIATMTEKENPEAEKLILNLKFLIYLGPIVMGIGIFFIILSFVVVCELREKVAIIPVKRGEEKYESKLGIIFKNRRNFKYEKEDLNFFKAVVYAPCLNFETPDVDKGDGQIKIENNVY